MGMSYECALDLVSALNADFQVQLVETMARGVRGGGAKLTLLGEQVFAAYREVERQTDTATADRLGWLRGMLHVKPLLRASHGHGFLRSTSPPKASPLSGKTLPRKCSFGLLPVQ